MSGLNKTFSILIISILIFSVPVSAEFNGLAGITGWGIFDWWDCFAYGINCEGETEPTEPVESPPNNPGTNPAASSTPCGTYNNGDVFCVGRTESCGSSASAIEQTFDCDSGYGTCCKPNVVNTPNPCDTDACSSASCSGYDACTCAGQCGNNINCNWGSPSVGSCGGAACEQQGSRSVTRTCGPSNCNTAAECSYAGQQDTTSESCTMPACAGGQPVNGGWSAWSHPNGYNDGNGGTCSKSCDGGTQTRVCNNPSPANNGAQCSGPTQQSCNTQVCPTAPETCECDTSKIGIKKCELSNFEIYKRQDGSIGISGRVEAEIESCCKVNLGIHATGGPFSTLRGYQEMQTSATAPYNWWGRIESTISGPVHPGTYGSEVHCKTGPEGPGATVNRGNDFTVRERID